MNFATAVYLVGFMLTSYLIYRYGRYSPWRSTPIGRAFMASKTAIWALFAFVLTSRIWPDWEGRDEARIALVGYTVLAVAYQLRVVISFQGGWRRRRQREDTGEHAQYSDR